MREQRASGRPAADRQITGRQVLIGGLAAFAVVLAANITMVVAATSSFPGLVAKNSYVASQDFDRRTAEMARLGWSAALSHEPAATGAGRLVLRIADRRGAPARPVAIAALVGRPSDARSDIAAAFAWDEAAAAYVAPADLAPGLWRVALQATAASGEEFETEARLFVAAAVRR